MITKKYLSALAIAFSCVFGLFTLSADAAVKKSSTSSSSGRNKAYSSVISRDPYIGAISIDMASGKILFEENADTPGYPASMVKLMDLMIILDKIDSGALKLDDKVNVTAESAVVGGSQVYLKQGEIFSIEELLYAMMIQSANDAATALALHLAGTKEGFIQLMNAKAAELGMKATKFSSVHGLPPATDQQPDITTARDMALLSIELVKRHPDAIRYTSTTQRFFRPDKNPPFDMRTHNHLLGTVEGCDGLKTGYIRTAGFSICATAIRNNRRVIAVVLGSLDSKVRDAKARELITTGFMNLPPLPPPPPLVTNMVETAKSDADKKPPLSKEAKQKRIRIALYIAVGLVAIAALFRLFRLNSATRF